MTDIVRDSDQVSKKKKKNKSRDKVSNTKINFERISQIKSEWQEEKNFTMMNKVFNQQYPLKVEVLKEANDSLFKVEKKFLGITPQKTQPLTLQNSINDPHDILKDQYLLSLYRELKLEEDQFAFFIPEFLFTQLLAVNKKLFPWFFKIIKENNKFIFYEKLSPENPFLFFQTMDENEMANVNMEELTIAQLNEENTLIEESFYSHLAGEPIRQKENYQYLKITLDENIFIYTKLSLDCEDSDGKRMMARCFSSQGEWKNFETKQYNIYTDLLRNNINRVFSWILQAKILNCSQIVVGMVERHQESNKVKYNIVKVNKRSVQEFLSFFNINHNSLLSPMVYLLDQVIQMKENGNYILHMKAFESDFTIYKVTD